MSIEDLSHTTKPKSDQLNADDLISGPVTVTVNAITVGNTEDQPLFIYIGDDKRPFKPCKSMRRLLIFCWGKNGNDWIGRAMTLYNDPDVKWAGKAIGGIRISHLSGIDQQLSVALTVTRGKRKPYVVQPLTTDQYKDADIQKHLNSWHQALSSGKIGQVELINKIEQKGKLTDSQKSLILNQTNQPADL